MLQFSQAMSSPSGAVSTLIGLFSFAGPALILRAAGAELSDVVMVHTLLLRSEDAPIEGGSSGHRPEAEVDSSAVDSAKRTFAGPVA